MAGLFDALGTAVRGLGVVQRSLATTGHNIANVDTPGFSRQRAVLVSGTPQPEGTGTVGSGVEQRTIDRVVNEFVEVRLRNETSRQSELESQVSLYRQVESIVNDQLTTGLNEELSSFFGALDELSVAAEVGQPAARSSVLAAGQSLVDTVHRWDDQLRALQQDADRGILGVVPEINDLAAQIAMLNQEIREAETIAPANDLRDRQGQLVLELSERIEVTTLTADDGSLSVRLAGGLSLVDRGTAAELEAVVDPGNPNPFDPTFTQIFYRRGGSSFDVTAQIQGGELGALVSGRDQIVGGAVAELDAFAFTLAERFNAAHRDGVGLVDGTANNFFADLGTTTLDAAARNLRIDASIDPGQGGTLENIAAGNRALGVPGAAGDVSHVEALKDVATLRDPVYLAGDTPPTPTGSAATLRTMLSGLAGQIGQGAQSADRALEQQNALVQGIQDQRDSVSGVSIDEEVAQLVRLQSNFQANARVMRSVQEMLDDLFNAI